MNSEMKLVVVATLVGLAISGYAQRDYRHIKNTAKTLHLVSTHFLAAFQVRESNDDFVYNGFYLQTQSRKYPVTFSTSVGNQLASELQSGDAVAVNAIEETEPQLM